MPLSILHTESSIGWGGQELRILTEMEGMAARGHRVHAGDRRHRRHPAGRARTRGAGGGIADRGKKIAGLRALRGWLARNGREFDVINTHSSTDAWLVALAQRHAQRHAAGRAHAPCVDAGEQFVAPRAGSTSAPRAELVVTGEALKEQLVRDNRFDPAPHHVGAHRYRPRALPAARPGFGARPLAASTRGPPSIILATLRDWKGHDDLLDAWIELRTRVPGWQLLVVGDGPRRAHLEKPRGDAAIGR